MKNRSKEITETNISETIPNIFSDSFGKNSSRTAFKTSPPSADGTGIAVKIPNMRFI